MTEAIDYVKTDLMPDFDFDFNHENSENYEGNPNEVKPEGNASEEKETDAEAPTGIAAAAPKIDEKPEETPRPTESNLHDEVVDKW